MIHVNFQCNVTFFFFGTFTLIVIINKSILDKVSSIKNNIIYITLFTFINTYEIIKLINF